MNDHVDPLMASIINAHVAASIPKRDMVGFDKRPVAPAPPAPLIVVPDFPPDIEALQAEIEAALPERSKHLADKFAERLATWAVAQGALAAIGGGK